MAFGQSIDLMAGFQSSTQTNTPKPVAYVTPKPIIDTNLLNLNPNIVINPITTKISQNMDSINKPIVYKDIEVLSVGSDSEDKNQKTNKKKSTKMDTGLNLFQV